MLRALDRAAQRSAARGDASALAAAAATAWTDGAPRGDDRGGRGHRPWRCQGGPSLAARARVPAADAVLACRRRRDAGARRLAAGRITPAAAAQTVRTDLLDTYDGRIARPRGRRARPTGLGFDAARPRRPPPALGYWAILGARLPGATGRRGATRADAAIAGLAEHAAAGREHRARRGPRPSAPSRGSARRRSRPSRDSSGARASSSGSSSSSPIEYGRGVDEGKVTRDFEIQEAITFRDGAAGAFADLESVLLDARSGRGARDRQARSTSSATCSPPRAAVARSRPGARRGATTAARLDLADALSGAVEGRGETADFDVIAATLDRLEAAAADGEWGKRRVRRGSRRTACSSSVPSSGCAASRRALFQKSGYFWYGADGRRRPRPARRSARRPRPRSQRRAQHSTPRCTEAEERIGAGPRSRVSVVTNSAIIVFREGLEAVLILAALMASMVGAPAQAAQAADASACGSRSSRASRPGSSRRPCSARSRAGARSSRRSSRSSRSASCS